MQDQVKPGTSFFQRLADRIARNDCAGTAHARMAPKSREYERLIQHKDSLRSSAVMVLLYYDNGEPHVIYIKRQVYDGPHSGQIAFPGGKREEYDKSMEDTALRETREEIGIAREDVAVIGALTPIKVYVSNHELHPFVGYLHKKPSFHIDPYEVDRVICISLTELFDRKNKTTHCRISHGMEYKIPCYILGDEILWGASAMITAELECLVMSDM